MKIPLMKRRGILMKFIGIMMLPTFSVGTLANMMPMAANATHDSKIPKEKRRISAICNEKNRNPIAKGTTETIRPNAMPAKDLPTITESKDMGAER